MAEKPDLDHSVTPLADSTAAAFTTHFIPVLGNGSLALASTGAGPHNRMINIGGSAENVHGCNAISWKKLAIDLRFM